MAAALGRLGAPLKHGTVPPTLRQCEASPADITYSGVDLYCLGDEYMTQGKRTLTGIRRKTRAAETRTKEHKADLDPVRQEEQGCENSR